MMGLIDTHCHLDFSDFDQDRVEVLDALVSKEVTALVVPSVGKDNWQRVLTLAAAHDNIYPALGIHPCFLSAAVHEDIELLAQLLAEHRTKVVAVGECGLDFSREDIEQQRFYLTAQIKLAKQFKLPLILHHRQSSDILLAFLRKFKPEQGGVIHAFSGSEQQARQFIELGFKLGIGGTITYDRAQKTRDVVARVPLESLVLETDAPDMPIYGRQGQRNSPEYLGEVFTVLSLLRDEPAAEIKSQLAQNTRRLFSLDNFK